MQDESAKSNNQHNQQNQQNEIPKDYSLLRKFDLEAAKRGEFMCNVQGEGKFKLELYAMNANDYVVGIILEGSNGCCTHSKPSYLRMLPLCWIEGKPVYKGDVLWRKDKASGKIAQVVVNGLSEYDVSYLDFVGGGDVGLDFAFSTLHWEKPKVKVQKVQKEGWMNIYPSIEYSAFPCENSVIYRTKEIADDCANSNRIDCVKVQWEVEE